jgi:hypothetical protein
LSRPWIEGVTSRRGVNRGWATGGSLDTLDTRDLGFAPAIPTWEMGIMIRTRTAGLVAAMMPCRLCCRTAPHGAPAAGTRAMRP